MTSWLDEVPCNMQKRRRKAKLFYALCSGLTALTILMLVMLIAQIFIEGSDWLSFSFLDRWPSRFPAKAGIKAALWGSVWLVSMTACMAIPIGVGTAIYLEEYAKPNRLNSFIELNLSNLAGVPSIIYGILGLTIFVRWCGLGRSLWSGSLTMSLLVLPVIVLASREAIRAVPSSIRQAAFALSATRWQTIWHHVLPSALPSIVTGVVLALSRSIGETAPLIILGMPTFLMYTPDGPHDNFTVLPMQIYNWASLPQKDFHSLAAAGILVLLAVLFVMNGLAVFVRIRSAKRLGQ